MTRTVHPEPRSVVVHRPGSGATLLSGDDELDGGDVVSGFRVALGRLFAD